MNIEKITQGKNLTDTERTVLEYILDHLDTVQTEGVRGVARANYTSTSTIMRLARKMNYSGFVDMCYKLRSFTETPHQTMQEEEDFLNGFSTQSLLNYNTYTQLKVCAEKLLEQRDKMTFVYGTGFSGTVATYLTQKLVNMGILCFSATGGDSVGIFENTLDRMVVLSQDHVITTEGIPILYNLKRMTPVTTYSAHQLVTWKEFKRRSEKEYLEWALRQTDWNISAASRELSLSTRQIFNKINEYDIEKPF